MKILVIQSISIFFATFHELFFKKIPLSVEIFWWVEESNVQPKLVEAYFNVV